MIESSGTVVAVARDDAHRFSKPLAPVIELVAGVGVAGDAHAGETVQHRSRVARDPTQPNLRQVHLVHAELFDDLAEKGFAGIGPGMIGENITLRGIDLLALPRGTRLVFGDTATVTLTGLRNPCAQLDRFRPGLMRAVLDRDAEGGLVRLAGAMAIVATSGRVRPGDVVAVTLPEGPLEKLAVV